MGWAARFAKEIDRKGVGGYMGDEVNRRDVGFRVDIRVFPMVVKRKGLREKQCVSLSKQRGEQNGDERMSEEPGRCVGEIT
jgi:hypothetical protein